MEAGIYSALHEEGVWLFLGGSWAVRFAGGLKSAVRETPARADSGSRSVFQIKNQQSEFINRQSIRAFRDAAACGRSGRMPGNRDGMNSSGM